MKRFRFCVLLLAGILLFAQTPGAMTVTIPADVLAILSRAHLAEYQINQKRAAKLSQKLTEDANPSTIQGMIQADLATIIVDKVQRFSPADLPAKQTGESDADQRNRYHAQMKSKIVVR